MDVPFFGGVASSFFEDTRMDVSQLRRLKELEGENAKLKKMYAELALVHHALQDVMAKKL